MSKECINTTVWPWDRRWFLSQVYIFHTRLVTPWGKGELLCHMHLCIFSSVQFSRSIVSNSLRPHELQHARPPCPSPTPKVHPNPCPLSQLCHPTISSSVIPFSSHIHLSQHQGHFQWVSSSHQVAKVLEFQLQHQSFQWTPRTDLL